MPPQPFKFAAPALEKLTAFWYESQHEWSSVLDTWSLSCHWQIQVEIPLGSWLWRTGAQIGHWVGRRRRLQSGVAHEAVVLYKAAKGQHVCPEGPEQKAKDWTLGYIAF